MTYNPYREHEKFLEEKDQAPVRLAKQGLAIAGGFAGGSSLLNRILPLLSQHIPEETAKKAITKINPKLGNFVESATNLGHDFYDVRDFLRAKAAEAQEEESKPKKAKETGNIIQQYSPELFNFLSQSIQQGRSPLEAAALASMQTHFKKVIKKMTEDHKAPFSSIISSVFGNINQPQQQAGMGREALVQQFNQGQQGGGQGKAALTETMQQITNALRQMRGNG